MKQLLTRFCVGTSLGFAISTGACAQIDADDRECVFDEAEISEVRYSSSSAVAEYLWDDSNKVAKGVLASGSLFQAKYWACDHYGARAISLVGPLTDIDPQALTAEFILLADLSLDTAEADLVRDHLTQSPITFDSPSATIPIRDEHYSEFTLHYHFVSDLLLLEVKHYRD